jgi:transcription initiation factor IIF auxiliary subunit
MTVKFDNYARKINSRGKTDQYQWRVFVKDKESVLDSIERVTYLLHPTFVNPLRVIKDRKNKFELVSIGWGEFDIDITIKFKEGKETKQTYYLDLGKDWPDERIDNEEQLTKILRDERWHARTFDELKSRVSGITDDETRSLLKKIGAVRIKIPKRDEEFWGFEEDVIKMLLRNEKWDMRSFNTISYYFPEENDDNIRDKLKKMGSEKTKDVNGKEMWKRLR